MSRIEKVFAVFDRKVEKKVGFLKRFFKRYFPIVSTLIFCLFVLIFVLRIFYSRPHLIASIVEDDVKLITLALEKIDAKCNILSVDKNYNEIDFLNVKEFQGSQVGSLNLAYPAKWEGPYLQTNPTIQGHFYQIVKAKDGMFVVPGEGVLLPNGLVVGKDFMISREINVVELLKEGGHLSYNGKCMGARLIFKVGDWDSWHMKEKSVKDIDRMVREFNEAMPFTKNEAGQEEIHNA